ncbi:MAG: glycoside hydrolase family 9 protein, partial [Bacteroidales bacterium]|nr:glycoside hydrolase family 9 protein [Bacteroidales bacterium]
MTVLLLVSLGTEIPFAQNGILSSQIGYESGYPIRVLIRSNQTDYLSNDAIFDVVNMRNELIMKGQVEKWGRKWESHWWSADLSPLQHQGNYIVRIRNKDHVLLTSDTIEVGRNLLWTKCFQTIAFDFLLSRSEQARTGKGWRDCGSDLQEFSSHMVAVDALCDILKTNNSILTQNEKEHIIGQIIIGSEYLAHLQDKADSLGFGIGPVVHEDRQKDVVTGNVVKASMIFAKVAHILKQVDSLKSSEYLDRAKHAFIWIEKNGPIVNQEEQIFFSSVHGAPQETVPPQNQWMTRDLVMMIYAAVEIFKTGDNEYKDKAIRLAQQLVKRQVPQDENEEGFYGHFYTYDDYTEYG